MSETTTTKNNVPITPPNWKIIPPSIMIGIESKEPKELDKEWIALRFWSGHNLLKYCHQFTDPRLWVTEELIERKTTKPKITRGNISDVILKTNNGSRGEVTSSLLSIPPVNKIYIKPAPPVMSGRLTSSIRQWWSIPWGPTKFRRPKLRATARQPSLLLLAQWE